MELTELCKSAKEVSRQIGNLDTNTKNEVLRAAAEAIVAHTEEIIRENEKDLARGRENHMPEGLLDRLMLNPSRMEQMAEGLRQVADLADPIGEVLSMKKRPNGLMIGKKRVPLGVVGMIYEARPNVTVDAFALCFKTGNAVILKGGSDAISSNIVIVSVLQEVLETHGIPRAAVSLIEDTSRETAATFMKMNEYVDVLIPRLHLHQTEKSIWLPWRQTMRWRTAHMPAISSRALRVKSAEAVVDVRTWRRQAVRIRQAFRMPLPIICFILYSVCCGTMR